jgi:hypothetical protein
MSQMSPLLFISIGNKQQYRQVPLFGVPLIGSFRRNQKKF